MLDLCDVSQQEIKLCEQITKEAVLEIQRVRTAVHVSINELSQRTGISRFGITRIEGFNQNPTLLSFIKVCRGLNVDPWKVLKEAESKVM